MSDTVYDNNDKHFLSSQECANFLSLIGSKKETEEVTANMAGNFCNSVIGRCNSCVVHNNKWVIDSGANQHMTSTVADLEYVNWCFKTRIKGWSSKWIHS